jgi:hypothetical protein
MWSARCWLTVVLPQSAGQEKCSMQHLTPRLVLSSESLEIFQDQGRGHCPGWLSYSSASANNAKTPHARQCSHNAYTHHQWNACTGQSDGDGITHAGLVSKSTRAGLSLSPILGFTWILWGDGRLNIQSIKNKSTFIVAPSNPNLFQPLFCTSQQDLWTF